MERPSLGRIILGAGLHFFNSLLVSRMSEAPVAASGVVELLDGHPLCVGDARDDELRDARAALHHERLFPHVRHDHADLAAVGGVYGAGGVQDGDAVLQGQAGFGAHLAFVAVRDGHLKAGGDEHALAGLQQMADGGVKVQAGVAFVGYIFVLMQGKLKILILGFLGFEFYEKLVYTF